MRISKSQYVWLIASVAIFSLTYLLDNASTRRAYDAYLAKEFQRELQKAHQMAEHESVQLVQLAEQSRALLYTDKQLEKYRELREREGILFYLMKDRKPILWSGNGVPKVQTVVDEITENMVARLGNGWYDVMILAEGDYELYSFHLIKRQYLRENRFLFNGFHPKYGVTDEFDFDLENGEDSHPIYLDEETQLFSIKRVSEGHYQGLLATGFTIFYLLSLLGIIITAGGIFAKVVVRNRRLGITGFLCTMIGVRLLVHIVGESMIIREARLFDPMLYASSTFIPSLGDLMLWCLLAFYMAYFWNSAIRRTKHREGNYLDILGRATFLSALGVGSTWVLQSVVLDSRINIDLSKIYELDIYSYFAIFSAALLYLSFFLLADTLFYTERKEKWKTLFSSLLIYAGIQIVAFILAGSILDQDMLYGMWVFPAVLLIVLSKGFYKEYKFSIILALLVVFSSYGAIVLKQYTKEHEGKERKLIADKLAEQDDPVAEYLFSSVAEKMAEDRFLLDSIGNYWNSNRSIDDYISKKFLTGYWTKYDATITACAPTDSLVINPQNALIDCEDFFLKQVGKKKLETGFYEMLEDYGRKKFLGICQMNMPDSVAPVSLFIEFYSKIFPRGEGYPELLLDDKELNQLIRLDGYSYAIYDGPQLISSSGDYHYPLNRRGWLGASDTLLVEKEHDHIISGDPKQISVVVSRVHNGWIEHFATFSYLFTIYCLVLLFSSVVLPRFPIRYKLAFSQFDSRVQAFLVLMILFSCTLFGIGSVYYLKQNYLVKNERLLAEKVRSVLTELEHKLGGSEDLTKEERETITYYLVKFSNVFYTDINLYDLKGNMIASSRDEVFDIGLTGRRMDIHAYNALKIEQKTEFIHEEKVGELGYLSAYVPFVNEENELLAYLNLPYFARQNELEKEISSFLVALINIYVMLFVLSILIAVIFSNYISRPIKLIGQRLSQVQFGKSNELITWTGNDEIGRLVNEYNRMVIELSESAAKLAQSERELAWREMAKQVAHEIKNPLTPMKLSIQLLQRASDDKVEDLDERIDRTSETLIHQIETLSNIASEFSDFAKMPATKQEEVHLTPLVNQVTNLFKESDDDISMTVTNTADNDLVYADKDQLIRIFNNLIKNAFQAVPEGRTPQIAVDVKNEDAFVLITVTDNGKGIAEELRDRIFQPNFTTKSSGTGLGLAMVSSMVETANGEIWFETEIDQGTSFFVRLPLMDD